MALFSKGSKHIQPEQVKEASQSLERRPFSRRREKRLPQQIKLLLPLCAAGIFRSGFQGRGQAEFQKIRAH